MNRKFQWSIAALIIVAIIVFLLSRAPREASPVAATVPPPKATTAAPTPSEPGQTMPLAEAKQADPKRREQLLQVDGGILLFGGTAPYRHTVVRLIQKRPDLGFSAEAGREIQDIYTNYCGRRAALEASLAKVTEVDETTRLVEIPAYKEQGEQLFQALTAEINQRFGAQNTGALVEALRPLYAGDNWSLGASPRTLLISADLQEPAYDYKVVRSMPIHDPVSGALTGSTTSIDYVKYDKLGVYEGQASFFPSLKGKTKKK